jgi:hypothetical protein
VSDNVRTVLITVAVAVAVTVMTVSSYRAEADRAPVEACERLSTEQAVAACLRGLP